MLPYPPHIPEWDDNNESGTLCGLYLSASPHSEQHTIDKIRSIFNTINQLPTKKNRHILQLQTAGLNDTEILASAEELLTLCRYYGIVFLINDRSDLVLKIGADGIFISQQDVSSNSDYISKCRSQLGDNAIIGINCGNSEPKAILAKQEGIVDFVLFETFFAPPHYIASRANTELLSWWSTYSEILCVAKGHITPDNYELLVQEGADFLCCDSFIWNYPHPEKVIEQMMKQISVMEARKKIH